MVCVARVLACICILVRFVCVCVLSVGFGVSSLCVRNQSCVRVASIYVCRPFCVSLYMRDAFAVS